MNQLQELKELYYKELDYRDHISEKITASITFFTVLCTGHMFIWSKMAELDFVVSFFPLLFLSLEILCVIETCVSFRFFVRTYYKNEYGVFPVEEIIDAVRENEMNKCGHSEKDISKANDSMINSTLVECIKQNRKTNQCRLENQLKMNRCLLTSFIILILVYALWIFVINKYTF